MPQLIYHWRSPALTISFLDSTVPFKLSISGVQFQPNRRQILFVKFSELQILLSVGFSFPLFSYSLNYWSSASLSLSHYPVQINSQFNWLLCYPESNRRMQFQCTKKLALCGTIIEYSTVPRILSFWLL